MRKIIQVLDVFDSYSQETLIYALCNDGSIWYQSFDKKEKVWVWERDECADIPQDEDQS